MVAAPQCCIERLELRTVVTRCVHQRTGAHWTGSKASVPAAVLCRMTFICKPPALRRSVHSPTWVIALLWDGTPKNRGCMPMVDDGSIRSADDCVVPCAIQRGANRERLRSRSAHVALEHTEHGSGGVGRSLAVPRGRSGIPGHPRACRRTYRRRADSRCRRRLRRCRPRTVTLGTQTSWSLRLRTSARISTRLAPMANGSTPRIWSGGSGIRCLNSIRQRPESLRFEP